MTYVTPRRTAPDEQAAGVLVAEPKAVTEPKAPGRLAEPRK
ncbi:hypothetical protein [Candidatus Protofrankia californiensis]|nr:hypothetical protein [Candidatus Protofrankia californiensis]